MEINWNLKKISEEIEKLKTLRPKTFEEEASKYYALKAYYDLLWARTANDRELGEEKIYISKHMDWMHQYSRKNNKLEKKLVKILDEQSQQRLIDFMRLTQNHSLRDTLTNIEAPIINKHQYQLPPETLINMGDNFFNTIPFMDRNLMTKLAEQNMICLCELHKTHNPHPLGTFYTTGHILCSYKEKIDFDLLISILHEITHSQDFKLIDGYFDKDLHINNLFIEFFAKLIELLSLDFFVDKIGLLALDVDLYKYNFLNSQNNHLKRILSRIVNPATALYKIQTNQSNLLLDAFDTSSVPMLMSSDTYNEKEYYEGIIRYMEEELLVSKNTTAFTEFVDKLRNPLTFILPTMEELFGNTCPSVRFAEDVLLDGKYLLSTLLAMKFYYLIKNDREKGFALLKEVSRELILNYNSSRQVLQRYGLEDYLLPDYIQQYAADYNLEKKMIKRAIGNNPF